MPASETLALVGWLLRSDHPSFYSQYRLAACIILIDILFLVVYDHHSLYVLPLHLQLEDAGSSMNMSNNDTLSQLLYQLSRPYNDQQIQYHVLLETSSVLVIITSEVSNAIIRVDSYMEDEETVAGQPFVDWPYRICASVCTTTHHTMMCRFHVDLPGWKA